MRVLQPVCQYDLKLKGSKGNLMIVKRTIPKVQRLSVAKGDVRGVELIAIRPKMSMDVQSPHQCQEGGGHQENQYFLLTSRHFVWNFCQKIFFSKMLGKILNFEMAR